MKYPIFSNLNNSKFNVSFIKGHRQYSATDVLTAVWLLQGYGSGLKEEELMMTHRHMNVNVTSSGQGTRTVVLQIPRVRIVDTKSGVYILHFNPPPPRKG